METARVVPGEGAGDTAGMPGLGEFIVIVLILSVSVFWFGMVFDCLRHENEGDKTGWILLIVLTGILGALIHLFARRIPRRRTLG
jgi:hypothetical protein